MPRSPAESCPEGTRLALIEAGIRLFGQQSFAATSTRQLAAEAKTNIASIAYHFGGKDGLRLACAEEFVRRMKAVVASVPPSPDMSPAVARRQLQTILRAMVGFLVAGDPKPGLAGAEMVPFLLRELAESGPVSAVFYKDIGLPTHRRLCGLWAVITGADAESAAVRLAVFTLIGQVVYFRLAAPIVTTRMGWVAIGPQEAAQITETLLSNLDAQLNAFKGVPK